MTGKNSRMKGRGRMHQIGTLGLAGAFALVTACTTVPGTERRQLMLIDEAQAAQAGAQEFQKMKQELPVSRDASQNAALNRVGGRLARVVNLDHAQWEFVVFDKPKEPNAFALPGGKVGVFSGLFPITQNDAGLATVVAHEVAHVVARHGAERMSQGALGNVVLGVLGGQSETTQQVVAQAYGVGVLLPFSRKQELEADRLGLMYMARAGYNPQEAIDFWKRFAANSGGGTPEFLSTHPMSDTRIAQLQSLLPEAMAVYQQARR